MKFGLTKNEYNYIKDHVVKPLEQKGATVWCYGSRARGDHRKFSDLDLMIESSKDFTQEINSLQETLSNSNFPYKVDLVQLKDFASSYKPGFEADKIKF